MCLQTIVIMELTPIDMRSNGQHHQMDPDRIDVSSSQADHRMDSNRNRCAFCLFCVSIYEIGVYLACRLTDYPSMRPPRHSLNPVPITLHAPPLAHYLYVFLPRSNGT